MSDLPPYDHDAPCPKCRYSAGTTNFHPGYHGLPCALPEAHERNSNDALVMLSIRIGGPADAEYKPIPVPEHFDRTCPNCKHIWAEAPVA